MQPVKLLDVLKAQFSWLTDTSANMIGCDEGRYVSNQIFIPCNMDNGGVLVYPLDGGLSYIHISGKFHVLNVKKKKKK